MHLFFQIQSIQLLIFCMDGQKFLANLDYVLYVFFCNIIKVKHYCIVFIILLHLVSSFFHKRSLLVPCTYASIKSIDWTLLSSSELKSILLISSVKTFCLSLLNLCCAFNFFFFFEFFMTIYINFFSKWFFLFSIGAASKQFL